MESKQSNTGSFTTDGSFEVEEFSTPMSPEVEGCFVEPSRPEPHQFKLLAQGADSAMPEASAAEAVEDRMGGVSERDDFIPKRGAVTETCTKLYRLDQLQ
ncbi:hypothetical protein GOODEAATRI_019364 [Goodea atripinnis]|uniref:Uncharacterized protein n=1 Tax=Goodea atripinnis TaxID=208336 RepID=A0ABV0MTE2_9TELE